MSRASSPHPLDLPANQSISVKWEPCSFAQLDSNHAVERVPFPSNAFYFTHNFWINDHTLIFESPIDFIPLGPYYLANHAHLFQLEYAEGSQNFLITKLTESPVKSLYSVLSHDKKYLYTQSDNKITRFSAKDFSDHQEVVLDIPSHHMMNQLMIHPDGSKLLFELNLNLYKPDSDKKSPRDSSINYIDTNVFDEPQQQNKLNESQITTPVRLCQVPYPYCLHHILCNPIHSGQISFCKTMYESYPKIKETNERLWLLTVEDGKWREPHQPRLLYIQDKKRCSKSYEIVTHESWCSNGNYLTFVSRRNKIKRVFVRDGSSEILVEGHKSRGPHPWHCDGSDPTWITFDTMNKNTGLWIKNLDTGEMFNISKTMTAKNCQNFHPHPFFSPRKDYVFFNSDFDGEGRLYRVKTNI